METMTYRRLLTIATLSYPMLFIIVLMDGGRSMNQLKVMTISGSILVILWIVLGRDRGAKIKKPPHFADSGGDH